MLSENIFQLQQQLNRRKISVFMDNSLDLHIKTDKDILSTVIRNLLTNAIKYSPDGSKIDVGFTTDAENVAISVTDYGIGMNPTEINELLSTGTNVNSKPDVEGEKGAGLGLILCKELLQKISGKLTIESEVGKGCEFVISIPVSI